MCIYGVFKADPYDFLDTAPCEVNPVEEIFPKPETEEEKRNRLWKAVLEASQI